MFPERLKKLRESKGLTLRQLADNLGVHFSTVGKYESGERQPDPQKLSQIAAFFNVSVDYLLGNTDEPSPYTKIPRDPGSLLQIMKDEGIIPKDRDITEEELARFKEIATAYFKPLIDNKPKNDKSQ